MPTRWATKAKPQMQAVRSIRESYLRVLKFKSRKVRKLRIGNKYEDLPGQYAFETWWEQNHYTEPCRGCVDTDYSLKKF
jgi:hypothetical protein